MDSLIIILNNNQWVIAVLIFILTIFIWWLSWLFSYIKHKPKLKIKKYSEFIPYFFVDNWLIKSKDKENWFNVERIVFMVWLCISNIGFSKTTIESYRLEYEDINWEKHKLIPISLPEPLSNTLWDYKKIFPSLTTNYPHLWINNSWKIDIWENILWFLYFNIEFYWNYKPLIINNKINSLLYIEDIYWKTYKYKIQFIRKDIDYLSTYIKPDILLNNNSYEESLEVSK